MKRAILSSLLTVGLFAFLLNSPSASAAGFIQKIVTGCPRSNVVLVPAGGRINIKDIILSTNKPQTVTLKFTPGPQLLMRTFLGSRSTVVSNFTGQVEPVADESALKLDCAGESDTTVTVTIVGTSPLD